MGNLIHDIFGEASSRTEVHNQRAGEVDENSILAEVERALDLQAFVAQRKGNTFSYAEKLQMLEAIEELEKRKDYRGHEKFFPDSGPFSYDKYAKHVEFLNAGGRYQERIFMAANRVGKSIAGGYEMACHLTGIYPHWWTGKRFLTPTDCWAAGDTGQTTRDIVQSTLLGEPGDWGTGMIARELILEVRSRPGIPGAVDTVKLKHASGGVSKLGFKSYDQKRRSFQGTSKHAIWLDEEPPMEVYGECLMRTMTTRGLVWVTFTPLMGLTPFVQDFLDAARDSGAIPY